MTLGAQNDQISRQMDELFSSILIEQQKYSQIKAGNPDKKERLKKILTDYEQIKGRGFFYEYLSTGRGHGPFTELVDESVKYDLIGAIGVNLLGHSHPLTIRAHLEASTSDVIMCGNLLTHQEAYQLSKSVVEKAQPSRLKHFWFAGSGSFANDSALKMIWQKKSPKYRLIAFEKAFAGRSIATQDITYNKDYRENMPQSLHVDHIPHFNHKSPKTAAQETINALENLYKENGDVYCAIMIELVQGEGGFIFGTKEYYEKIFQWAKSKNIYVWVDEVQTFARTSQLFAFQHFGLEEYVDIVTVGKALQSCGVLYTDELNPKPGLIAGTFNGSIASLKAGYKYLQYLTEGNFYGETGRIKSLEKSFIDNLSSLREKHGDQKIGYVGGVGTMISFEVGKADKDDTTMFVKKLFENGLICFSAGKEPTRVRFLLPLSLNEDHITEIFQIIDHTIVEVFG